MAWYRTLVPITYTDGVNTYTVSTPGTRVDLSPSEAASLQGLVVLDGTSQFTYPKADVLFYSFQALFPAQGQDEVIYFANDAGLFFRWDDISQTYVAVGVPTNWDSIDTDARDDLTNGESTMSRRYITGSGNLTAGTMTLSFFTARKTESVTQLRMITGSQAQSGATLCRAALFSVDSGANLYLIGSTPNDTTVWTSTNTAYTRQFSSGANLVRGNRYAVGVLQVGGTAASFVGSTVVPSSESFQSPMLCAQVASLSDLPSSVVAANLAASSLMPYCVVMP